MNLTIRLAGGELVQLAAEEQPEIYERLWRGRKRGSIMAALKLRNARQQERLISLDEQESAAFREAMQHVRST